MNRLIAKMLIAILGLVTFLTMTGCNENEIDHVYKDKNTYNDLDIVITQKDANGNIQEVKHRGDVTQGEVMIDRGGGITELTKYTFNCNNEPIFTNKDVVVGNNVPDEFYDEKCSECFPNQ